MGKGQEKGGSIVRASCWLFLTLVVDRRPCWFWLFCFFSSFHMIFWRHLEILKHVQSSSARVWYWRWVRWIYIRQETEGQFSLPLGNVSYSKCRLLYWRCWLDSHRLVCTVLIKEGCMYGILKSGTISTSTYLRVSSRSKTNKDIMTKQFWVISKCKNTVWGPV